MQIKAPPNFVPEDSRTRQIHAPPVHARYRKFDLYRNVQQFNSIDNHAIQVAQTDHDNFTDLIHHLVYSQNLQADLDKCRVIFRWMTSKNMYTINFRDGAKPNSPEDVLLSFKNKQGTYARIFETLCRFAGVSAVVLTGYAKGLDYRPGDKFKGNDYNHSWNAVLIDNNWYLVDSHWATRYLVSEKNMPENLVYEYDDFYFLTDPEQLIYSHWAHKKEWQLLHTAVTLQDFENLPLVKSYFFKCGMFFISHHNGVVDAKKGRLALTLGFCKPTNFTYKITFADTGEEVYQGQKLKNYALQHQGQNQTTTFILRAPRSGQYYFTIFAQLLTGELGVKNIFTASAEYKVITEHDEGDVIKVSAELPVKGEYGIEVYGNDPAKDGDTYTHICQYYIHYATPNEQQTAFYQESPERRDLAPGQQSISKPGRYNTDSAGLNNAAVLQDGHGDGEFPPPPPELLQQQFLYGTVPDSRQQPVQSSPAFPQSQGVNSYAPGVGQTTGQRPQQAELTQIPASTKPIQVEKRSVGQEGQAAPSSFQLQPQSAREPAPTPAPAGSQQKPTLEAIDRHVLESVDDHAIQVSKSEHSNFKDLVWDLIFAKNITNELEKVRVIFRWLATKNLKEMNFDKVEKGSPEEVLMGLKTGKTTYAMVFDTLCNYAGLHSQIISGYAKGADYRPGQKFTPGTNQHSWNAVYIYGTWCLIDAHWAARRIIGKQATNEDFHYQLDEYFFLPDPHQLIYTHFPDDPQWQLLERQITLQEFESMPHMKPQFFKYGLEFVTHRTGVIHSRGELHIRLRYPADKIAVAFNFTIQFEDGNEEYNGVKLNRFGLQESSGRIASFSLRLPVQGSYILYIYAKEDTPENKDNVYAQVCEYKVEQEHVPLPTPEPYPPCSYLNWGAGSSFYRYNLSTYQQTATLNTREGKVELQIKISTSMQFMAKLKSNNFSDSELEGYVLHRIVGNTAYFNVSCPGRGEYGLEIYANNPDKEGSTLYHVAQYLILCQEDVKVEPLPTLPHGYLGKQQRFDEFGLSCVSHIDPVVHLDGNTVTVAMKTSIAMRVTANLIQVESDEEFPDFVFSNSLGSQISFIVNLPTPGYYKLQIYAMPQSDPSQQLPGVFNYLINCRAVTQAVFPFPKQYAQWKEGCFMYEPGVIPTNRGPHAQQVQLDRLPPKVNFRVSIPKAEAVAVVAGQQWTHLDRQQGDEWAKTVEVVDLYGQDTRLTLNANFGGDKTSYSTLLEYIF
uniref:Transglutaminase-like domain-containing protein n=1 Tax=Arion vulgaris TaxID=1028688 RepID=A0A0B7AF40_9EUPU